ncbi:MAG: ATP-binding protein [Ilumatobacter sp.]
MDAAPAARIVQAFDRALVSLSLSDQHGRIVATNEAFRDLFGYDRTVPLDVGMLSRAEDQGWTLSYLTRLVTGDIDEFRSLKRLVRADGSEFDGHVDIRAIREDGQCVGMIASVEPVERRETVDDERVRKLLQHAAGTLTLVDPEGAVIETSGRYRETLGYPEEFWEDRTILDIVVPDDLQRMLDLREVVLAAPEASITEDFRVFAVDRSVETLEVSALNMLHDPDLAGIVLSTRNVTADRDNMRAVARLRDEAVAEAEQRSHLLATVSHELRNPLHAMSGLAELLASDDSLESGPRDLAGSLLRQLRHLTSVTDDLLDTARLEVGRLDLRPMPLVVGDLVDDVIRFARSAAAGRIDVRHMVTEHVPHLITADPARVQQVLSNLVGNAVKFTESGSVRLTVDRVGSATDGDEMLTFEVVDTGVGIPRDQFGEVFQPFSSATTAGDRRGAGLGLAIVQRLVDALGGTLTVDSEVGVGSTFRVAIPLVEGSTPVDPTPEESAGAPQRLRVLVIEDTAVNQQLARHQLDRLGMDAVIAESAEIGLDRLDVESFDAILMDHQLPGMNGRDATREIRRRGFTTPVIGVTASSTAADERASLDAGMTAFLAKPVGLDRLGEALALVLRDAAAAEHESESVAESSSDAVVDVRVLDELADELGDRDIVAGLVRTYLDELGKRRDDIIDGAADVAARQAHTLKSSSKLLGAGALSELCAAAEHDPEARAAVGDAVDETDAALRRWLADS